jgi:hypothetical protein
MLMRRGPLGVVQIMLALTLLFGVPTALGALAAALLHM